MNVSPLILQTSSSSKIFKIDLGFDLQQGELMFLFNESNNSKASLYSFSLNHNKYISFSKSEGFRINPGIYIYTKAKNHFYISVISWTISVIYPGTINERIKRLWNPTATDVTESFDPSGLILVWPENN